MTKITTRPFTGVLRAVRVPKNSYGPRLSNYEALKRRAVGPVRFRDLGEKRERLSKDRAADSVGGGKNYAKTMKRPQLSSTAEMMAALGLRKK